MRDASTKIGEAKSAANAAASNFSNPAFYTERMWRTPLKPSTPTSASFPTV